MPFFIQFKEGDLMSEYGKIDKSKLNKQLQDDLDKIGILATDVNNLAKNKLEKTVFDLYKNEVTTITDDLKDRITKTTRVVVGTLISGWTDDDCDYLCNGTNDEVEINNAIQSLPSTGGEIKILDGNYKIGSNILINKNNLKIKGSGSSTKLIRSYNGTADKQGILFLDNVGNCIVSNLFLDGLKNTYTSNYNNSIIVYDGKNNIVENCVIQNSKYSAIYIYGAEKCIVRNNFISDCDQNGILFNKLPFDHDAFFNIVSNNIIENINGDGIDLNGIKNIVEANTIKDANVGIFINKEKNTICNNFIIRGDGNPIDYDSGLFTIRFGTLGSKNLCTNNYCAGKDVYNQGVSNTLDNNKI